MEASVCRPVAVLAAFGLAIGGCGTHSNAPPQSPPHDSPAPTEPTSSGPAPPGAADQFTPVTDTVAFELTPKQVRELKDRCADASGSLNHSESCASDYMKSLHHVARCQVKLICLTVRVPTGDAGDAEVKLTDPRPGNPLCADDPTGLCRGIKMPVRELAVVVTPTPSSPSPSSSSHSPSPSRPAASPSSARPGKTHEPTPTAVAPS